MVQVKSYQAFSDALEIGPDESVFNITAPFIIHPLGPWNVLC